MRACAGVLYPLERAFLYLLRPELIPFEHIASVEFERQSSGTATALRTFDMTVHVRGDSGTAARARAFQFRYAPPHVAF